MFCFYTLYHLSTIMVAFMSDQHFNAVAGGGEANLTSLYIVFIYCWIV